MGLVSISLNGRPYEISCDDGQEEHVAHLADVLGRRVSALSETVGQVGEARLLLMAGLLVTDELVEARAELEGLASRVSGGDLPAGAAMASGGAARADADLAASVNALAQQIEEIVESLKSS